jgi:uncharacterized membrane protein YhaH (DUF805 family)
MSFFEAINICFRKYADFTGRAPRSEYWWFVLFVFLVSLIVAVLGPTRVFIFHLAVLLPQLAVGARRLHDTDRSGFWLLLGLVPLIGPIVLLIWFCQKSDPVINSYGPPPLSPQALGARR